MKATKRILLKDRFMKKVFCELCKFIVKDKKNHIYSKNHNENLSKKTKVWFFVVISFYKW